MPSYMRPGDEERIKNQFTYHKPQEDQVPRYQEIRSKARELAMIMARNCPPSAQKDLAIQLLAQAVMSANASIAVHEDPVADQEN